jgi:putative transposase
MVTHPAQYDWSSYKGNVGMRQDRLITPHAEYLALASSEAARQSAYDALVNGGVETSLIDDIRGATGGGYPLGSESFKQGIAAATGRRTEAGKAGRPAKVS